MPYNTYKLFLNLTSYVVLTSCTSTYDAYRYTESAYDLYNKTDAGVTPSVTTDNKTNLQFVIVTGMNPDSPTTPKGWGALIISVDGEKMKDIGDKAVILPGEHTLEIKCYSPGSEPKTDNITKIFELNKKYIISSSHEGNNCNIFTIG
jgi:hypothetical protein